MQVRPPPQHTHPVGLRNCVAGRLGGGTVTECGVVLGKLKIVFGIWAAITVVIVAAALQLWHVRVYRVHSISVQVAAVEGSDFVDGRIDSDVDDDKALQYDRLQDVWAKEERRRAFWEMEGGGTKAKYR